MCRTPASARTLLLAVAFALLGAPLQAAAQPVLSVDPTNVDFGEVPAGSTSGPNVITVANTGDQTLSATAIFFGDNYLDQFSFQVFDAAESPIGPNDYPFDIAPGQPAHLHTYFTASEWASFSSGTINVQSNGGNVPVFLMGFTGPPIVPTNTWIPEVLSEQLTPEIVAMGVVTGTVAVPMLTVSPTGAATPYALDCFYVYDYTNPTVFNQATVLESDFLYLGRNIIELPEGSVAAVADSSGLKLLTTAQPWSCQWSTVAITDTLYATADIARLDSGYVVIGYKEGTESIDVFTGDLTGPPVLATVITDTLGIQGPDIFPPAVSAGAGSYCVHAANANGYFATCPDTSLGGVFDSDSITPARASPAAGFFSDSHVVVYHHRLSDTIRFAKIEQEQPVTQTLGAAPVGTERFGVALAEGWPGTARALWPGGDVEIVIDQPATRALPEPFPVTFTLTLAAQQIHPIPADPPFELVASGGGSLLFARFLPDPPVARAVPTASRWAGVLIALLLVLSAVAATRRARAG